MALLYGIASSVESGEHLVGLEVPYVQLRIKKGLSEEEIERVRGWSLDKVRVVINDSVEQSVRAGTWGVHLGQEDLQLYQKNELLKMKPRLGISVHSLAEWEKVRYLRPALAGFGPIFSPLSKSVPYAPHGVVGLRAFLKLATCPVVAIGGILPTNLAELADSGVYLIAMLAGLKGLSDRKIIQLMREMARASDKTC